MARHVVGREVRPSLMAVPPYPACAGFFLLCSSQELLMKFITIVPLALLLSILPVDLIPSGDVIPVLSQR